MTVVDLLEAEQVPGELQDGAAQVPGPERELLALSGIGALIDGDRIRGCWAGREELVLDHGHAGIG